MKVAKDNSKGIYFVVEVAVKARFLKKEKKVPINVNFVIAIDFRIYIWILRRVQIIRNIRISEKVLTPIKIIVEGIFLFI